MTELNSYSFQVIQKPSNKSGQVEKHKYILKNVNATAKSGELLAVVGPSGSGKSTFLDAIAGRIQPNSLEGSILVNGLQTNKSFNKICAYVMQASYQIFSFHMNNIRFLSSFSVLFSR